MNTTGINDDEIAQGWEFLEAGTGPAPGAAPGAGPGAADLGIDPALMKKLENMNSAEMLRPAIELLRNRVTPPLDDSEIQSLCNVYGAVGDKWCPMLLASFGIECVALGVTFAVFAPRMKSVPQEKPAEPVHAAA